LGDDIVKKVLPSLLVMLWACDMAFAGIASSCPPPGFDRAKLKALAANDWQLPAGTPRDQLAFGLSECLTDPDPELRDTLAFSGLQRWMRSGELGPAVRGETGNRFETCSTLVGHATPAPGWPSWGVLGR